jgi:hypothetical protein
MANGRNIDIFTVNNFFENIERQKAFPDLEQSILYA